MKPRKKPKPLLIFLCCTLLFLVGALAWLMTHETSQEATTVLLSHGVEPTNEQFIRELMQGHESNISHFIALGYNAETQDEKGLTALAAAAQSGNQSVLTQIMNTLPLNNNAEAVRIISQQDNYGKTAIIAAAIGNNTNNLSMLLVKMQQDRTRAAAILNIQDQSGKTALYYAALKGNQALLNILTASGADTAITDNDVETPLMVAIKLEHYDLLPALIAADKNQHQKVMALQIFDSTGTAPLTYVIRRQKAEIVKTLLDANADVNLADARGQTPLMTASRVGNPAIVEMILAAGAKTDVANKFGETPLSLAIKNGHFDIAKLLLDKGASPDFHVTDVSPLQAAIAAEPFNADFTKDLLARSSQIRNIDPHLLFQAADRKNAAIMKLLIDAGLNVNITNEKGETLLYSAILAGDEDTVLLIIEKGADIRATGVAGITPIQLAVGHNEPKVVAKLVAMGVPVDEKTTDGYTLAEMAVYEGHPEILEMLLAKGAKVNLDFCVLWAIRDGHGKSVDVLLKHGANPNVMNENGETAIWLASETGETEAVQALIAHHAHIDFPDKNQNIPPIAIASHNGQLANVKILAEAGAKLEAKDNSGFTALAHAVYMSKPEVVEYLIGKGADIHTKDIQGRSLLDLVALTQISDARTAIEKMLQSK
jgi:ankyrin repeat protein